MERRSVSAAVRPTRANVLLLLVGVAIVGLVTLRTASPVLVHAQTRPGSVNLVSNPSFEVSDPSDPRRPLDWYAPVGPKNVYASGGSYAGNRHVESALAGTVTSQGCVMANANWISQQDIAIDPTKTYTLSFWTKSVLRSTTAHNMPIAGFEFFDAQAALVGTGAVERGPLDLANWSSLSYVVGAGGVPWPSNTAYVRVNIGGAGWDSGTNCEAGRVYATQAFDDISFAPGELGAPNTGDGARPKTTSASGRLALLTLVSAAIAMGALSLSAGLKLGGWSASRKRDE